MRKIPFDIMYRPQIESGEYKVVSRENKTARIVCWDMKSDHYPILALIDDGAKELYKSFTTKGRYYVEGDESSLDLFIIPEIKESDDRSIIREIRIILESCATSFFEGNGQMPFWYDRDIAWLESLKDKVQPQPKQDWSEEDEKIYQSIMDDTVQENQLNRKQIDWLRNLKYRHISQSQFTWKPSDEQIGVIEAVINNRSFQRRHLDSLYEQLKKLRKG